MNNNKNNIKRTHSSSSNRTHHHSKSYKYKNQDSSSEMERRGENIIYDNVRKEKVSLMIKRCIFCLLSISIIAYLIISIFNTGESSKDYNFFNKGISVQEANELNNKIIKYEFYIEELEARLSEYEDVDGMFVKSKK